MEDLDFADDLALLSHTHNQMVDKTSALDTTAQQVGLNIHRTKTKTLRAKTTNTNPIPLGGEPIEDVDSFTYLGSIVSKTGGTDKDVKTRKRGTHFLCCKNSENQGTSNYKPSLHSSTLP